MPRLHVWAFIGGGLGATYYVSQEYFFKPRYSVQRDMERFVEADKAQLVSAIQRLNLVRNSVFPVLNSERITTHCDCQLLREQLFRLPPRLQSAFDKRKYLREIDALQSERCGLLKFRDAPLTQEEQWKSFVGCVLYSVVFCLVLPVCKAFGVEEMILRQVKHGVAKHIMTLLDCSADISFHPETLLLGQRKAEAPSPQQACDSGDDNSAIVKQRTETLEELGRSAAFLFRPMCWIEDVAFWSLPCNPLLLTATREGKLVPLFEAPVDVDRLKRASEKFEERFYEKRLQVEAVVAAKVVEGALPGDETGLLNDAEMNGTTTLGYKVSVREAALPHPSRGRTQDDVATRRWIPVAVGGTPQLVYVSDALSGVDQRPKFSADDRYRMMYEAQYKSDEEKAAAARAEQERLAELKNRQIETLRKQKLLDMVFEMPHEMPRFCQASLFGVYGGRSANGTWRKLSFRVGEPATALDVWEKQTATERELHESLTIKSGGQVVLADREK